MTNKLWQEQNNSAADEISKLVEKFTVGNDRNFDILLAPYDVQASLAHAQMLYSVGLLTFEEWEAIETALKQIKHSIDTGTFIIDAGVEDVHSQIELLLTQMIGEAGKKIHTARSRNDQVLVDMKLFLREQIKEVSVLTKTFFDLLLALSEKHQADLLPGYTHFQIAMPSSFGLWFAAYAESLVDDLITLEAAYRIVNKNPLGSAAGYGSSFPINRTLTTQLLGFDDLNYNVVYAQMTRGKTEKVLASALSNIASTLGKLAYDVCLYTNQNFGFISFPDAFTTGSSIMPHKKNPDVFELIRAKANRIISTPNELNLLLGNLPSGYHRDVQLTKEILFPAIETLKQMLGIATAMFQSVQINADILNDPKYNLLFSVENVHKQVTGGQSFRDAYHAVAQSIRDQSFEPHKNVTHTHEGSMGNLQNDKIQVAFNSVYQKIIGATSSPN